MNDFEENDRNDVQDKNNSSVTDKENSDINDLPSSQSVNSHTEPVAPPQGTEHYSQNQYDRPPQRPQYPYNNYPYGQQDNQFYGQQNNYYGNHGSNSSYNPQNHLNNGQNYRQNNPYSYSNQPPVNGYAYPQNNDNTPVKKKNGGKVFIILAIVLLLCVIGGILVSFLGKGSDAPETPEETSAELNVEEFSSNATPGTENTTGSAGVLSAKSVFDKVKESSVGILVYDSSKALSSEGTGVIMTEDNEGKYTYIVTCAHVISDKNASIMVQLYSGKEYTAQVIGYDAKTDIGVLRIEENGLKAAEYGDSSKLNVGDIVYAIGNPGGTEFANSFTNGMISAIDRPVSSSETGYTMECIQHTAAINPGNSGGALVNEYGQVIGINSMKIIADEYEGMGFAVPSSVFIDIVNEIITNGYVSNRPKLGITYVASSTQQSYAMYVAIKGLPAGSIIVYSISEDSDLVNTEVQKGDMITRVNGMDLNEASDLSEVIENSKVGDELTLSIVRINSDYTAKEFEVTVKLVEDRGDTLQTEEETTASPYSGFYEGNGGYGSDPYEDFFSDFFGRYFNP